MKKMLSFVAVGAITTAPIMTTTSCSSILGKPRLEVWNYKDYIAKELKDSLENTFDYYEFDDLPELKQGIMDERVATGVGSDYYNAQLAGMGLIQKVNFSKVFDISSDKATWATELQKIYTPETWKLLNQFELKKYVSTSSGYKIATDSKGHSINDLDGDGKQDYLWEYMIPYFIQNKVIGINPFKIPNTGANKAIIDTLRGDDQGAIEALFGNKEWTYKQILNKLRTIGFSKISINDYFRDNLMIGSEMEKADGSFFTGDVKSKEEGQKYADNFIDMLQGWNVVAWKASGVENLTTLLDSAETHAEVSMLYNGDALFASAGGDDGTAGQIRIISPKNPTFLLDGMVIPSYIKSNSNDEKHVYGVLKNSFYQGAKLADTDADFEDSKVYQNFDYVNYSPVFKNLQKCIKDSYFVDGGDTDAVGRYIALSTENLTNRIDQNHITIPITEGIENNVENYFSDLHKTGVY